MKRQALKITNFNDGLDLDNKGFKYINKGFNPEEYSLLK